MFKRDYLPRLLLALTGLALAAGAARAQSETPAAADATRLRVANLAPLAPPGQDTAITVEVNAVLLPNELSYGESEAYQTQAGGPGSYPIDVVFDGGTIISGTITLDDGDYSLAVIGDMNLLPADLLLLPDNAAPPAAGRTVLRVAHAAPIDSTIDGTRVDVCTQDGTPFDDSANGLRYKAASNFKSIPANVYDLKITRAVEAAPCTGETLIDPPEIDLPAGAITTLYLIGDGTNRATAVFTFEDGIIGGEPEPTGGEVFIPAILR